MKTELDHRRDAIGHIVSALKWLIAGLVGMAAVGIIVTYAHTHDEYIKRTEVLMPKENSQ